jgi:diaminohydroxyphosphoribosylaminopyrimidine deaminase/5-amino-6-(5-phosphoribosylamino)uracil reductase
VILDSKLRLSANSRIVRSADKDLLVFTSVPLKSAKARKLQGAGVEIVYMSHKRDLLDWKSVLSELGRREILNVLLEAGPRLNGSALAANLVDRLFLFYTPKIAGHSNTPLAVGPAVANLAFREKTLHEFGPDFAIDALLHNFFDL